jgi:hypothetical protein
LEVGASGFSSKPQVTAMKASMPRKRMTALRKK